MRVHMIERSEGSGHHTFHLLLVSSYPSGARVSLSNILFFLPPSPPTKSFFNNYMCGWVAGWERSKDVERHSAGHHWWIRD